MKDLLPYLVGAASTFVVQLLIQVYVVPLVETRKRRLERWEKDVLDLGELMSGVISDSARRARDEQTSFRLAQDFVANASLGKAMAGDDAKKRLTAAHQATRAFNDQVRSRAEWMMDRIIAYRLSDQVIEFAQLALDYRVHVTRPAPDEWRELAGEDFDAWWAKELKLRAKVITDLMFLSIDRSPLHISWRARLDQSRYRNQRLYEALGFILARPSSAAEPKQGEAPVSGSG